MPTVRQILGKKPFLFDLSRLPGRSGKGDYPAFGFNYKATEEPTGDDAAAVFAAMGNRSWYDTRADFILEMSPEHVKVKGFRYDQYAEGGPVWRSTGVHDYDVRAVTNKREVLQTAIYPPSGPSVWRSANEVFTLLFEAGGGWGSSNSGTLPVPVLVDTVAIQRLRKTGTTANDKLDEAVKAYPDLLYDAMVSTTVDMGDEKYNARNSVALPLWLTPMLEAEKFGPKAFDAVGLTHPTPKQLLGRKNGIPLNALVCPPLVHVVAGSIVQDWYYSPVKKLHPAATTDAGSLDSLLRAEMAEVQFKLYEDATGAPVVLFEYTAPKGTLEALEERNIERITITRIDLSKPSIPFLQFCRAAENEIDPETKFPTGNMIFDGEEGDETYLTPISDRTVRRILARTLKTAPGWAQGKSKDEIKEILAKTSPSFLELYPDFDPYDGMPAFAAVTRSQEYGMLHAFWNFIFQRIGGVYPTVGMSRLLTSESEATKVAMALHAREAEEIFGKEATHRARLKEAMPADCPTIDGLNPRFEFMPHQALGCARLPHLDIAAIDVDAGGGKCVDLSTTLVGKFGITDFRALMDRPGFQDMEPGEVRPFVMGVYGDGGNTKASHLYYDGKRLGYKARTRSGYAIHGTDKHQIKVWDDESQELRLIRLDTLMEEVDRREKAGVPGLHACIQRDMDTWGKADAQLGISSRKAFLMGALAGDGACSTGNSISIEKDHLTMAYVERMLKKVYPALTYRRNEWDRKSPTEMEPVQVQLIFHSPTVKADLGFSDNPKSRTKRFNRDVLKCSRKVVRSYMRGLYCTDGYLGEHSVMLGLTSWDLIKFARIVLLNMGIVPQLKKKQIDSGPFYHLKISGADVLKFHDAIGFPKITRRWHELDEIVNHLHATTRNPNLDVLPITQTVWDGIAQIQEAKVEHLGTLVANGSATKGEKISYTKLSANTDAGPRSYHYDDPDSGRRLWTFQPGRSGISHENAAKMVATFTHEGINNEAAIIQELLDSGYYFDPITSVQRKRGNFADFHVPDGHLFFGNGFTNHNTLIMVCDALLAVQQGRVKRPMIVVPNSTLVQQYNEILDYTDGALNIIVINSDTLRLRPYARTRMIDMEETEPAFERFERMVTSAPPNTILLTSYEFLRRMKEPPLNEKGQHIVGAEPRFFTYDFFIERLGIDMVTLDESHKIKNDASSTAQSIYGLAEAPIRRIATGTMLPNSVMDVWAQVNWLDPSIFGSKEDFTSRYADVEHSRVGTKGKTKKRVVWTKDGLKRLRTDLTNVGGISARRSHWIHLLPEKKLQVHVVTLPKEQRAEYNKILQQIVDDFQNDPDLWDKYVKWMESTDEDDTGEFGALLQKLIKVDIFLSAPEVSGFLRDLGGEAAVSPKVPAIAKIIEKHFAKENPGKVLVFVRFTDAAKHILENLEPLLPPGITAAYYDASHKDVIPLFKREGKAPHVLVCVDQSIRTGMNLQVASRIIRADLDWSAGENEQSYARAFRAGQKRNVNIDIIVVDRSLETIKLARVIWKLHVIRQVTSNFEDSTTLHPIRANIETMTSADYTDYEKVIVDLGYLDRYEAIEAHERTEGAEMAAKYGTDLVPRAGKPIKGDIISVPHLPGMSKVHAMIQLVLVEDEDEGSYFYVDNDQDVVSGDLKEIGFRRSRDEDGTIVWYIDYDYYEANRGDLTAAATELGYSLEVVTGEEDEDEEDADTSEEVEAEEEEADLEDDDDLDEDAPDTPQEQAHEPPEEEVGEDAEAPDADEDEDDEGDSEDADADEPAAKVLVVQPMELPEYSPYLTVYNTEEVPKPVIEAVGFEWDEEGEVWFIDYKNLERVSRAVRRKAKKQGYEIEVNDPQTSDDAPAEVHAYLAPVAPEGFVLVVDPTDGYNEDVKGLASTLRGLAFSQKRVFYTRHVASKATIRTQVKRILTLLEGRGKPPKKDVVTGDEVVLSMIDQGRLASVTPTEPAILGSVPDEMDSDKYVRLSLTRYGGSDGWVLCTVPLSANNKLARKMPALGFKGHSTVYVKHVPNITQLKVVTDRMAGMDLFVADESLIDWKVVIHLHTQRKVNTRKRFGA